MGELFTPTHLILVLAVAFLLFGSRKLPELGKGLGEGLRGFKDAIKGEDPNATKTAAPLPGASDAHTVTPQPDPNAQPK